MANRLITSAMLEKAYLEHHGVKGMKWGVRKEQTYSPTQIANDIKRETDKYASGGPSGNQNCQLCTWSAEMSLRGIKTLPRPVYSPRDIVFKFNGYDIIKNPEKISISSKETAQSTVLNAGKGSRFYTHVNWKNSASGHEFILTNIDNKVHVIDGQAGLVKPLSSKEGSKYLSDINFKNSYLVRMDNKPINQDILKYNDKKYLLKWDDNADIQFLKDNNMI